MGLALAGPHGPSVGFGIRIGARGLRPPGFQRLQATEQCLIAGFDLLESPFQQLQLPERIGRFSCGEDRGDKKDRDEDWQDRALGASSPAMQIRTGIDGNVRRKPLTPIVLPPRLRWLVAVRESARQNWAI